MIQLRCDIIKRQEVEEAINTSYYDSRNHSPSATPTIKINYPKTFDFSNTQIRKKMKPRVRNSEKINTLSYPMKNNNEESKDRSLFSTCDIKNMSTTIYQVAQKGLPHGSWTAPVSPTTITPPVEFMEPFSPSELSC